MFTESCPDNIIQVLRVYRNATGDPLHPALFIVGGTACFVFSYFYIRKHIYWVITYSFGAFFYLYLMMSIVIHGVVSKCILKDSIDMAELGEWVLAASVFYLPFTCLFIYATILHCVYRMTERLDDARKVKRHALSILFLWLLFSALYSLLSGGDF